MTKALADVPGQEGVRLGAGAAQIGGFAGRAARVGRAWKAAFAIKRLYGEAIICLALKPLHPAAFQRLGNRFQPVSLIRLVEGAAQFQKPVCHISTVLVFVLVCIGFAPARRSRVSIAAFLL